MREVRGSLLAPLKLPQKGSCAADSTESMAAPSVMGAPLVGWSQRCGSTTERPARISHRAPPWAAATADGRALMAHRRHAQRSRVGEGRHLWRRAACPVHAGRAGRHRRLGGRESTGEVRVAEAAQPTLRWWCSVPPSRPTSTCPTAAGSAAASASARAIPCERPRPLLPGGCSEAAQRLLFRWRTPPRRDFGQ